MTSNSSPYTNFISARSRRFRVIGVVLIVAILGMAGYGATVLMPSLRAMRAEVQTLTPKPPTSVGAAKGSPEKRGVVSPSLKRAQKVLLTKVVFLYAYWIVCALLVLTLVIVAWLDFREVMRNYLTARQTVLIRSKYGEGKQDEG